MCDNRGDLVFFPQGRALQPELPQPLLRHWKSIDDFFSHIDQYTASHHRVKEKEKEKESFGANQKCPCGQRK